MSTTLRRGPLPRYYQLKEIAREKIRSGEWKPGDLIPSERELGEHYGISRMTVRQAITELVNEGVFLREQGKGTFVRHQMITQPLARLTGFTEDMRARGRLPSSRVLAAQMVPVDENAARRLRVKPGQPVLRLRRLRLADDEPLAIELSLLSFIGCERLLEEDLEKHSLYRLLEDTYRQPPMGADQEIEAGLMGPEEAALLKVPAGSAALFIRRTTCSSGGKPIEYAESIYCGNKYLFFTVMKRA